MSSGIPDGDALDVRTPSGQAVARARVARGAWTRFRGLIRRPLPDGEGMLFPSCRSVHTHFMSYAIDLVYLSKDLEVVKIAPAVPPWRFSWGGRRAKHVIELPAGAAEAAGIRVGETLEMSRASEVAQQPSEAA